ncbi:Lrp/AsnC family transcriptional regulator [Candidatus Woesearchaeota archaeon]|nr:Lrp/AsnC family transcriptional regulator [Candidatus Woesearchaeota archaeon]
MDNKDCALLNILLENSRLSYREIAKKAGCSVVTVINRVREMEKVNILTGYTANLNYEKLGYDVTAVIQLRISKGKLFEVEKKIATNPSIFAVYDVTGNFDSLVIAKFKNRKALDAFLKKIQTYDFIERTETSLVLNTIKEKNIQIE